jgi:outer membrane lipoprotein
MLNLRKTTTGHRQFSHVARLATLLLALGVGACSSVPEHLRGEYPPLVPQAVSERDIGTEVRWGGVILSAHPDASKTCFEILSRELGSSSRPRNSDMTSGRFIACTQGFQDPEVFSKGREVTVVGQLQALDVRMVGQYNYRYPVLAAQSMSMWPERPDIIIHDFYDPFFHPWYWGPGFYPYGGPFIGPYPRGPMVSNSGSRERIDIQPAKP